MIVVDSSVLVAIVLGESDAERYADLMGTATIGVSAASMTEARMVLESRAGPDAVLNLDTLISDTQATVIPYDALHAAAAHQAWRRFGKGRHPASLNFGDCMAYATATCAGAPLLFKGNDFTQTDIASAHP